MRFEDTSHINRCFRCNYVYDRIEEGHLCPKCWMKPKRDKKALLFLADGSEYRIRKHFPEQEQGVNEVKRPVVEEQILVPEIKEKRK